MSGFKLLAIRPLEGCDEQFLKNLKEGMVYKFYQDYEFYISKKGAEVKITNDNYVDYKNEIISQVKFIGKEIDLYSQPDSPKINISAVVGQNGSGKSSIIELLNLFMYKYSVLSARYKDHRTLLEEQIEKNNNLCQIVNENIGAKYFDGNLMKLLHDNTIELTVDDERLQKIELLFNDVITKGIKETLSNFENKELDISLKLFENLSYTLYELNKILEINIEIHYFTTDRLRHFFRQLYNFINKFNEKIKEYNSFDQKIIQNFNCELFVLKNGQHLTLRLDNESDVAVIDELHDFYSIILNYSNSSYNSIIIGDWIKKLFHKNDGYQVPVVINPYRDKGNYFINKEFTLLKDRILKSIVHQINEQSSLSDVYIGKYKLKSIICSNKHDSYYKGNYTIPVVFPLDTEDAPYKNLVSFVDFNKNNLDYDIPNAYYDIKQHISGYLIHKYNTFNKYHLNKYFDKDKSPSDNNLEFFYSDKTHLTKKFRATANFFMNYEKHESYFKDFIGSNKLIFDKEKLFNWINNIKKNILKSDSISVDELILHTFPAIFKLDYILEFQGKEFRFNGLSSGEIQSLMNITTINYHIDNILSVHYRNTNSLDERIAYDNINVILDEIELYYHPNLQRNFIQDLLISFQNNYVNNKQIKGINILLSTHSPFILSDIPLSNVLRLKEGVPVEKSEEQTFGANIHQLLYNDFFLENGFIGEFAKIKVNEIIDYLKSIKFNHFIKKIEYKLSKDENNEIKDDLEIQLKILQLEISRITNLNYTLSIDKCKEIIDLVGEPVLKESLLSLHDEVKSYIKTTKK